MVDRRSRIVARSLSLRGRVLPTSLAAAAVSRGAGGYRTLEFADDTLRIYTAPLANVGGPAAGGAVIVGASRADVDQTRTVREKT